LVRLSKSKTLSRFIGLDIVFNTFLHCDKLIHIMKAVATSSTTANENLDPNQNVNVNASCYENETLFTSSQVIDQLIYLISYFVGLRLQLDRINS